MEFSNLTFSFSLPNWPLPVYIGIMGLGILFITLSKDICIWMAAVTVVAVKGFLNGCKNAAYAGKKTFFTGLGFLILINSWAYLGVRYLLQHNLFEPASDECFGVLVFLLVAVIANIVAVGVVTDIGKKKRPDYKYNADYDEYC